MDRRIQIQVHLPQGAWPIHPRQRILQSERLNVSQQRLLKIPHRFLFGLPLAIRWDVRDARRKPALLCIRNDLDRQALHTVILQNPRFSARLTG